jgi:hypothetical protein
VYNFLGVIGEDFEGHGVTDVLTNTDKVSLGFSGFRWKGVIVDFVEDFFPPVETEQCADVMGGSGEACHWDIAVHTADGMVQEEAGV